VRVAIVHDWLTGMRGGEKVLEVLCELYPDADIFTLVHVPERISATINGHRIHPSFIDRLPWAWRRHQLYLPIFPFAVEDFDLAEYSLVLSSSHCVAKGALTPATTPHICYCHTPMRYAWDFHGVYRRAARPQWLVGRLFAMVLSWLRVWDTVSARRPNFYIANSHHVRRRIERYYGCSADVVNPPVDCSHFTPSPHPNGDVAPWLVLSAMVPYKGLEQAIDAFNVSGRPLHVVGDGAERTRLQARARSNVTFFGWRSDDEVLEHYRTTRGLVFPGEEDFGITPLEANACGRPVVALGRGGVLESQRADETALFFAESTVEAINEAVTRAEHRPWDEIAIRAHAERFDRANFKRRMADVIDECLSRWRSWAGVA